MSLSRVLVVEDYPDGLEMLVIILEEEGFEVLAAKSAAEAFGLIRQLDKRDSVFSDLDLERQGLGREVCLAAERHGISGDRIAITSGRDREYINIPPDREWLFFPKPFDINELLAFLRR